ncbi:MAG: hypothetical protein ACE5EU_04260 [Paracoccaceae bacterium]
MTMFRALAVLFLLLGLVALGGDLYFALAGDGVIRLQALGEWWARIDRDSLLLLQPAVERHISPTLWDPGIQTVLEWPAVADFAGLGAVFWLLHRLGRRRRRRKSLRFHR